MRHDTETPPAKITVFTRHSTTCPQKSNPQYRRCDCRKSLYIYEGGKVRYQSAGTRSWSKAEEVATAELDKRDPEKLRQRREAEARAAEQAATLAAQQATAITVVDALKVWTAGMKSQSASTAKTYQIFQRKVTSWAAENGIKNLSEVSAAQLDKWRGEWDPTAPRKEDQMGPTTQHHFLSRLKSFFRWAYEVEHLIKDPAKALKSIAPSDEQTMPLSPEQFDEVLAAVALYDGDRKRKEDRFGVELKALCLVQRWTGLRITDVLMLPRTALVGYKLNLKTQKTKATPIPILPTAAIDALMAIKPRPGIHPKYFFWSRECSPATLGKRWAARVKRINKHLSLTDDGGKPMEFHSHMLRDTFAVELLIDGWSMDDVSKLLTHKSVRVTERYYARRVARRTQKLEARLLAAMQRMGATFSENHPRPSPVERSVTLP